MYAFDKLRERMTEVAKQLEDGLARVDSPEFAAEYPEDGGKYLHARKCGALTSTINRAAFALRVGREIYGDPYAKEIALTERLTRLCEELGIDEDNIADLETLVAEKRYNSDARDLREAISKAAGEVRDDRNERESDNAAHMLLAAGFTEDPDDGYCYMRTVPGTGASQENSGRYEYVKFEYRRKSDDYAFTLEVDEREVLTGKSGEFGKLLEAVGVAQNVKEEVKP